MNHLTMLGLVGIGGAVGAVSRYLITLSCTALLGKGFPFGTLCVNVVGCLGLGALLAALEQGMLNEMPWRPLVTVGFLGALTTFSTFSMDNMTLLQSGAFIKLGANILLNVTVCLLATWGGFQLLVRS
jgi:fluoride exporter